MNIIKIRGRAFNGRLEQLKCVVDSDGSVRVYDSVAGHYTQCHTLPKRTLALLRCMSKKQKPSFAR